MTLLLPLQPELVGKRDFIALSCPLNPFSRELHVIAIETLYLWLAEYVLTQSQYTKTSNNLLGAIPENGSLFKSTVEDCKSLLTGELVYRSDGTNSISPKPRTGRLWLALSRVGVKQTCRLLDTSVDVCRGGIESREYLMERFNDC